MKTFLRTVLAASAISLLSSTPAHAKDKCRFWLPCDSGPSRNHHAPETTRADAPEISASTLGTGIALVTGVALIARFSRRRATSTSAQ